MTDPITGSTLEPLTPAVIADLLKASAAAVVESGNLIIAKIIILNRGGRKPKAVRGRCSYVLW